MPTGDHVDEEMQWHVHDRRLQPARRLAQETLRIVQQQDQCQSLDIKIKRLVSTLSAGGGGSS